MGKWTFERWLLVLGLVGSITANSVLAGMNYQKFIQTQTDLETLKRQNAEDAKTFVRQDLYDLDKKYLSESINRLADSLDRIYALEQQTGEPSRLQRSFDR